MNESLGMENDGIWSEDMLWAVAMSDLAVFLLDSQGELLHSNDAARVLAMRLHPDDLAPDPAQLLDYCKDGQQANVPASPLFDALHEWCGADDAMEVWRRSQRVALLHRIIDTMVDNYRPVAVALEDRIEKLEEHAMAGRTQMVQQVLKVKRELATMRRVLRRRMPHTLYLPLRFLRTRRPG